MTTPGLVAAARAAGVRDARVLDAVRDVSRAQFVPADQLPGADLDRPLPIGHDQVTTQPSLVAVMIEGLELDPADTVLEVGTGLGYQTALLARLARFVHSVERHRELADAATDNLRAAGVTNVDIVVGDGSAGLPERAPFAGIVVAAAHPEVPGPLAEQLAAGGRLVQPIGPGGREDVVRFVRLGGELVRDRVLIGAHFVRLYGAHGFDAPSER